MFLIMGEGVMGFLEVFLEVLRSVLGGCPRGEFMIEIEDRGPGKLSEIS